MGSQVVVLLPATKLRIRRAGHDAIMSDVGIKNKTENEYKTGFIKGDKYEAIDTP